MSETERREVSTWRLCGANEDPNLNYVHDTLRWLEIFQAWNKQTGVFKETLTDDFLTDPGPWFKIFAKAVLKKDCEPRYRLQVPKTLDLRPPDTAENPPLPLEEKMEVDEESGSSEEEGGTEEESESGSEAESERPG